MGQSETVTQTPAVPLNTCSLRHTGTELASRLKLRVTLGTGAASQSERHGPGGRAHWQLAQPAGGSPQPPHPGRGRDRLQLEVRLPGRADSDPRSVTGLLFSVLEWLGPEPHPASQRATAAGVTHARPSWCRPPPSVSPAANATRAAGTIRAFCPR